MKQLLVMISILSVCIASCTALAGVSNLPYAIFRRNFLQAKDPVTLQDIDSYESIKNQSSTQGCTSAHSGNITSDEAVLFRFRVSADGSEGLAMAGDIRHVSEQDIGNMAARFIGVQVTLTSVISQFTVDSGVRRIEIRKMGSIIFFQSYIATDNIPLDATYGYCSWATLQ